MDALFLRWLGGVIGRIRSLRVPCNVSGRSELRVVIGAIPVADPLPDIAGHVVKPILVRWELRDRGDANVSICSSVFQWKLALIGIRHPLATRTKLIAPDVGFASKTSARCKFPFCFGGQPLSCPLRV